MTTKLAYDESERKHAFGTYTGCPCKVSEGIRPDDDGGIVKGHKALKIDDEFPKKLAERCPSYGLETVHNHRCSNWNHRVKLPYGEWMRYNCYLDKSGVCKLSLKDTGSKSIPEELKYFLDEQQISLDK